MHTLIFKLELGIQFSTNLELHYLHMQHISYVNFHIQCMYIFCIILYVYLLYYYILHVEFEEEEVLQLYEEKQMYEDRVKELEVNCKILQNENAFKEHKIEKMKQDIHFLKDNGRTGYDEIDNTDNTCVEHINMLEKLESRYETMEEENIHLKIVQRNIRDTINEKETSLKNLDKERYFYKRQADILHEELLKLQKESSGKDTMIKMLNEQIKQLKADLQDTRQTMEKMATESHVVMEQMKMDHAQRFSQLDNKLDCILPRLNCSTATSPSNNHKSADSSKNRMSRKQSVGSTNLTNIWIKL